MLRYILRRFLLLIVTMLITSVIVFGLTQLLPGDVAKLVLGRDVSDVALEEFRVEHHLNDPIPVQYVNWLAGFVSNDWGRSYARGNPLVRPLIMDRLANTARLGAMILLMSVPLSIFLGVVAALKVFTSAFVATKGGPAYATWFYALHIFTNAFEYYNMGYASALAWLFLLVMLAFTYIQFRSASRWVYYAGEVR